MSLKDFKEWWKPKRRYLNVVICKKFRNRLLKYFLLFTCRREANPAWRVRCFQVGRIVCDHGSIGCRKKHFVKPSSRLHVSILFKLICYKSVNFCLLAFWAKKQNSCFITFFFKGQCIQNNINVYKNIIQLKYNLK